MNSRRLAKAAHAIREQVSSTVLFGLRDPRVQNVTVLRVEVSPDMRTAKVYVSIMGDEKAQSLCMHGLNSSKGYLQSKIADRIQTRYTPVLEFVNDQGIKKSALASRLIRDALEEGTTAVDAGQQDAESDDSVVASPSGESAADGAEGQNDDEASAGTSISVDDSPAASGSDEQVSDEEVNSSNHRATGDDRVSGDNKVDMAKPR